MIMSWTENTKYFYKVCVKMQYTNIPTLTLFYVLENLFFWKNSRYTIHVSIIIAIIVISTIVILNSNMLESAANDEKPIADSNGENDMNKTIENITIGIILPLTGDLQSHGNQNKNSTLLAIDHFNRYLKSISEPWQFDRKVEDSATSPIVAYEKLIRLYNDDVRIILGLESSENIKHILDNFPNQDILYISCCSSATDLKHENLYRLVPPDKKQSKALIKLINDSDITVIIPIFRDDVWGRGMINDIHSTIRDENYDIYLEHPFRYDPDSPESLDPSIINKKIQNITKNKMYELNEIGIVFLGFEEIDIFIKSIDSHKKLENTFLDQIRWFGPGSITKIDAITNNYAFATKVNLTTVHALLKNDHHECIDFDPLSKFGDSSSFVYTSYDMVWILGLAILENNNTFNIIDFKSTIDNWNKSKFISDTIEFKSNKTNDCMWNKLDFVNSIIFDNKERTSIQYETWKFNGTWNN